MRRRLTSLVILLLLCSAAGCVAEPAPNANANANTNASINTNAAAANADTRGAVSNENVAPVATPGAIKAAVMVEVYMAGVARSLSPEMQEALQKVNGDARRLLALRGYLRGGRDLGAKWAWTQRQIDAYKVSAEHATAIAEVEKVKRKFAELNPGYTLHVNTEVRSLDEQVRKWNEADSVGRAGEELLTAAARELSAESYEPTPDKAGLGRFERFLRGFSPAESPSVAVPGLSPHGQLRAFDFQVRRGGELVAGTSAARAKRDWEEAGWASRLSEAVGKASTKFTGPLDSPYEPWHYTYTP